MLSPHKMNDSLGVKSTVNHPHEDVQFGSRDWIPLKPTHILPLMSFPLNMKPSLPESHLYIVCMKNLHNAERHI